MPYNGYAHSFAGMGIQFLLFAALEPRHRDAARAAARTVEAAAQRAVSRYALLGGKTASTTIVALMTLLVSFGFAMLVFKVRIQGSVVGFLLVAIACSMMAATFGLLVAALGKRRRPTRGVSTLAVLVMVMLGGAWVPTFVCSRRGCSA